MLAWGFSMNPIAQKLGVWEFIVWQWLVLTRSSRNTSPTLYIHSGLWPWLVDKRITSKFFVLAYIIFKLYVVLNYCSSLYAVSVDTKFNWFHFSDMLIRKFLFTFCSYLIFRPVVLTGTENEFWKKNSSKSFFINWGDKK